MKLKSNNIVVLGSLLALAMTSTLVYWSLKPHNLAVQGVPVSAAEQIAQVETIRLHRGKIKETFTAYGAVLPLPEKLKTVNVPYTCQIEKIQVNQGQLVQKGDLLITLKPGTDAVLQLEQAQSELNAALRENQLLQERIRLKLATKQDLVASQLRVAQANVMIKNLAERGIGKEQLIKAENSGIIYQVNVQQGQIVTAGTPLLQLVDQNQWVVRLGIEPEDYLALQIDQLVLITPVNTPVSEPVKGRIEIITHQIDPATRLINVFVRPELNQTLLINDFVEAQIIISTANSLWVPRQAVLPGDGGYSLFTVENGHAVKHQVQIGVNNDTELEVIAVDLKEQDEVVVLGNYELVPGLAVSAKPSAAFGRGIAP